MTDLFSKIKEVTEIPAISGHEAPVRDYLRQSLGSNTQQRVMPLASKSLPTWTKLVL